MGKTTINHPQNPHKLVVYKLSKWVVYDCFNYIELKCTKDLPMSPTLMSNLAFWTFPGRSLRLLELCARRFWSDGWQAATRVMAEAPREQAEDAAQNF